MLWCIRMLPSCLIRTHVHGCVDSILHLCAASFLLIIKLSRVKRQAFAVTSAQIYDILEVGLGPCCSRRLTVEVKASRTMSEARRLREVRNGSLGEDRGKGQAGVCLRLGLKSFGTGSSCAIACEFGLVSAILCSNHPRVTVSGWTKVKPEYA